MWDTEMEEIKVLLEKTWYLHDKLSDAIHSISRSHFLNSINSFNPISSGFVYVKDFRPQDDEDDAAIAEARSLSCIRTALENLEDHLEFFHTIQSLQKAERDAAIARLEQSRIVLAMRLADHQGKRYKVIEEAVAFVGDVHDSVHFVTPRNMVKTPRTQFIGNLENHKGRRLNVLMQMFISSFPFAKEFLKLKSIGDVLGNAAFVAVSMLALLKLHKVVSESDFILEIPRSQENSCYIKGNEKNTYQFDGSSSSGRGKNLDVFLARG